MKMYRAFGTIVALGALTALPACSSSMFGGGGQSTAATGQYSQRAEAAPAGYNMGTNNQTAMNNQEEVPTSPAMVRKVQRELKQNGDYNARIDGVWGPMTENGVRKWQQAHNLKVSGAIDVATLQSMNISNGQNQQANGTNNDNGNNQANGTNTNDNNQANGMNNNNPPVNNQTNAAIPPSVNPNANDQANTNGTTNNPNYNTAGTHQTGSSYSSNNGNPPNGTPYPVNNGTNNNTNNNGAAGAGVNNGNNGTTTH